MLMLGLLESGGRRVSKLTEIKHPMFMAARLPSTQMDFDGIVNGGRAEI